MRKAFVFLSLLAVAVVLPASAQTSAAKVDRITVVKAKPGMSAQWEAGLKKINEWAHQHKLPLTHYCWSIISGPRTGQYVVGVLDHNWKDFDTAEKASQGVMGQVVVDLEPYTESHLTSYWVYRPDLSMTSANAGQAMPAFSRVSTFFFKPVADISGIEDAIKQAEAAMKKSHWPGKPFSWYSLENGGFPPALAVTTGHANWADLQPPEPSIGKMLTEVYGKEGAAAIFKKFFGGMRAERTEIWRYRPDLSYIAASQ